MFSQRKIDVSWNLQLDAESAAAGCVFIEWIRSDCERGMSMRVAHDPDKSLAVDLAFTCTAFVDEFARVLDVIEIERGSSSHLEKDSALQCDWQFAESFCIVIKRMERPIIDQSSANQVVPIVLLFASDSGGVSEDTEDCRIEIAFKQWEEFVSHTVTKKFWRSIGRIFAP